MIPDWDEYYRALAERHGKENQEIFSKATIVICGLGGLGSNISICLARAGIGKLILVDVDKVDVTNLHRQQYKANQVGENKTDALERNLKEINPYIKIEKHNVMITEENALDLIEGADIVCEAFDNARSKAMLVNLVLEKTDKYILSGSGMAGFFSANDIVTKRIGKRLYLSGDGVSDVNDGDGLIASRVMVCGAHEAHMVLRILMGKNEP